jgi:hypothetical protein
LFIDKVTIISIQTTIFPGPADLKMAGSMPCVGRIRLLAMVEETMGGSQSVTVFIKR